MVRVDAPLFSNVATYALQTRPYTIGDGEALQRIGSYAHFHEVFGLATIKCVLISRPNSPPYGLRRFDSQKTQYLPATSIRTVDQLQRVFGQTFFAFGNEIRSEFNQADPADATQAHVASAVKKLNSKEGRQDSRRFTRTMIRLIAEQWKRYGATLTEPSDIDIPDNLPSGIHPQTFLLARELFFEVAQQAGIPA